MRNFGITTEEIDGLKRMIVSGFKSYDEALQYARQLYSNKNMLRLTRKCRTIIISDKNRELLGTHFSYDDYEKFYEKHFIPLRISTVELLTEPETIEYEKAAEETEPADGKESGDKLINGGVIDDDLFMQIGVPADNGKSEEPTDDTVIPIEDTKAKEEPAGNSNSMEIIDSPDKSDNLDSSNKSESFDSPDNSDTTDNPEDSNTFIIQPAEPTEPARKSEPYKSSEKPALSEPAPTTAKPEQPDPDSITIPVPPTQPEPEPQQNLNLEDDYYELDGF